MTMDTKQLRLNGISITLLNLTTKEISTMLCPSPKELQIALNAVLNGMNPKHFTIGIDPEVPLPMELLIPTALAAAEATMDIIEDRLHTGRRPDSPAPTAPPAPESGRRVRVKSRKQLPPPKKNKR